MHSSQIAYFPDILYCTCIIYGSAASRPLVKESEGSFSGWSCRLLSALIYSSCLQHTAASLIGCVCVCVVTSLIETVINFTLNPEQPEVFDLWHTVSSAHWLVIYADDQLVRSAWTNSKSRTAEWTWAGKRLNLGLNAASLLQMPNNTFMTSRINVSGVLGEGLKGGI